ncbi:MAG TPA: hypothetical protein VGN63_05360 [Flavisolibacter sp.]|jgi:hypothetical protein|nr:hypothetical protein [Flavisolibacter sp.]
MTAISIKEQVRTIEKATQNAAKSKESALKFLRDAGILPATTSTKATKKKK